MKKRIFVDMDGTLARFHDEIGYMERMFEKDFFRQLKPFQAAVSAVNQLNKQGDAEVFILSATIDGEPPYCQEEKNAWLDENCPEIDNLHRIFTKVGSDKTLFIPGGIHENDILWDDYNKNLEEWRAAGGLAVKCHNNINHKGIHGPLWDGAIIENEQRNPRVIIMKFSDMCTYNSQSENVRVYGHRGTWHTIETTEINGKEYYLLEHDEYGDEAANVIVDHDGSFVLEDVWNGFEDLQYELDTHVNQQDNSCDMEP